MYYTTSRAEFLPSDCSAINGEHMRGWCGDFNNIVSTHTYMYNKQDKAKYSIHKITLSNSKKSTNFNFINTF